TVADLEKGPLTNVEVEGEDDFLIVLSRHPMVEKDLITILTKGEKPVDPRVVVWLPSEMDEAEKQTIASVAAYLLVADEHRDTSIGKECLKDFRKDAHRVFSVLFNVYGRGLAKTSRTTLEISTVGGAEGALAKLAAGAMDTCYESRKLDFGTRKFD